VRTRLEAPAKEPPSISAARGVTRRFGDTIALRDLDLSVRTNEVLAIVGPSGCGKSTLLELFAGLQEPDAGTIETTGACAFMPQRDLLLPWRDALSNAGLALECAGASRRDARKAAAPLFERFGLSEFERAYPAELSGGMRQRVAFLRTLLAGRPILLLDEPFASLDALTRAGMQEWLADALASEPRTVVLVTHDVEEALYLADRVAVMSPRPGRVVAELAVAINRPRPRRETVIAPEFTDLRQRAMEALGC
jgi:ABC-type nitrate/sulfonate/bicarbonate transport system ATPase subunit